MSKSDSLSDRNDPVPGPPHRILHIITGLYTGGAETMLYHLLAATDRTNFSPAVVSLRSAGPVAAKIQQLGIPVYCLDMERNATGLQKAVPLFRAAKTFRPSLIQGWMYHGNIAGYVCSRLLWPRPRLVWGIHGILTDTQLRPRTRVLTKLLGRLSAKTDSIVYCSKRALSDHVAAGYMESRSCFIPNGIDTLLFQPDSSAPGRLRQLLGLPHGKPLVGVVARYDPLKDHRTLLQAAAMLKGHPLDPHYILIGRDMDETNAELTSLIHEFGLTDKVHLLAERGDVPQIMPGFDLLVSSSRSEAFSLSIAEAMSCGVPCIVTEVGDSAWMVSTTGKTIAPASATELAAAIADFLEMPESRRKFLSEAARQRIVSEFSLSATVQRYQALYANLIEG